MTEHRLTDARLRELFKRDYPKLEAELSLGENNPDFRGLGDLNARHKYAAYLQGARAIEAELSKQEPVAFVIARETAFDLPGRPRKELGYIVPAGSVSFPTQEAAHEAHREMGLPLGWVVMRLEQLVATPPQPAPDTVLVPREPTQDMLYAMAELDGWKRGDREHPMLTRWEDYWVAALAAAPKSTP